MRGFCSPFGLQTSNLQSIWTADFKSAVHLDRNVNYEIMNANYEIWSTGEQIQQETPNEEQEVEPNMEIPHLRQKRKLERDRRFLEYMGHPKIEFQWIDKIEERRRSNNIKNGTTGKE